MLHTSDGPAPGLELECGCFMITFKYHYIVLMSSPLDWTWTRMNIDGPKSVDCSCMVR